MLNPAWVCFTWVGMTVGVSLIATPVRFTATSITRPVALDVGRVVFTALNKAEFLALVLLLVVVRVSGRSASLWAACADIILAGGKPPPSYAHAVYSTLELAKIGILLVVGVRSLEPRD